MEDMAKRKKVVKKATNRARPVAQKAGVTNTYRRYGCGGKIK